MKKVAIINKSEVSLKDLLKILYESTKKGEFGAIVTFTGVVRGKDWKGRQLKKLIYDADKELAEKKMLEIREDILKKYDDLVELLIYHVIDELEPGEQTVFIVAAAEHRDSAFKACREAIDRVKAEAPIWKKEVSDKDQHWIVGEELVEV